jgi:hypothetical protein
MRTVWARVRALSAQVRGGLATPLALYVVDALVLSQGVVAFVVGWVMVVFGAIDASRGRGRKGVITIVAYVVLDVAVFGTIRANNVLARHRAERIVVALDAYKGDHGRYPKRLDELVPAYLPSIPRAKYTLMPGFNRFYYMSQDGEDGFIEYTAFPPFGRPFYRLKSKKWDYLD